MRQGPLLTLVTLAAAAGLSSSLAAPASASPSPAGVVRTALTTKAPYQPEGTPASYEKPPAGFTPVFTENVSRHGSRTLSDSSDGDALLALWNAASAANALTPTGKTLGPQVQQILDASAADGYGNLTPLGTSELKSAGERLERRLPGLFASAASASSSGTRISVESASQARTVQSADAFVSGLESANPKLAPVIGADTSDDALLYFHKSNAAYQDYVKNDPRVAGAESAAADSARSHAEAKAVLERSFTPAFVQDVAAGKYSGDFANEVDAATAVYSLWQVTADMPGEGDWRMGRYITPEQASWFGYLDDVTSFYENGPGFSGDDITYSMAGVLLNDMFSQANAVRDGSSDLVADLRFTHAEEIFPLATLLGLPGSTKQLPAGTEFTYANDPFRGASVAPMAANIQWDLFSNGGTYLVRMLYNDKQVAFKPSCAPVAKGSYFYRLDTLEKCYGYPLPAS